MVLILASVRAHRAGFLAAFLAVLAGVAIVTATLVIHDSSAPRVQPRFSGAAALALPHQAVDTDGRDADRMPWSESEVALLVRELAALDGVASAVADRSFYAQAYRGGEPVRDEGAQEAGHGFSSTRLAPYELVAGRAPRTDREVVVDRALGPPMGTSLTVNLAEGRRDFTVVGTVDGPGYWFTDAFAARQQPGVQAIGLTTADRTDGGDRDGAGEVVERARQAVGDSGTVVSGNGRSAVQPAHLDHQRFLGSQLLGAMALLGLFTTVFVVASMLVLATGLRRRELGLLRTLGASPRQVRRMILGEAALIGVLGSAAGALAGLAAAPPLRAVLAQLDVLPADLPLRVSAWPLLTGAAVGTGVSVLGAWSACRRAARVAPLEALLEGRTDKGPMGRARTVCGLAALLTGAVLALGTAATTTDDRINAALLATTVLIAAAALLAPFVVVPVARTLTAPFARSRFAGPLLVRGELTAHPRRAAALAAPVIAAVGFAVLLTGMVETMRVAYPASEALKLKGQVVVTPDGTPGHAEEVADAHPVGKASIPTRAYVTTSRGDTPTVVDVLGSRDPRWAKPGQAVLGSRTAASLNLRAGDRTSVRFADGSTVPLRIADVLPDDPARGDFVVSRDLVRTHDPAALTDDIFVPAAHAPSAPLPGTAVHDATRFALDDYRTDAELTESLAWMLIVITTGYAGIAVANGTAVAARSRRRDLTVLRTTGATTAQLLRAAAAETALTVTAGASLGIAVTLPPRLAMASGLSTLTGTDVGLHLNLPALTATVATTLAVAVTATLTTTHRTMRRGAV